MSVAGHATSSTLLWMVRLRTWSRKYVLVFEQSRTILETCHRYGSDSRGCITELTHRGMTQLLSCCGRLAGTAQTHLVFIKEHFFQLKRPTQSGKYEGRFPAIHPGVARYEDKRVLRSQDVGASRVKSDLCQFFPDYEEVLFGPPREDEILNAKSTLFITDKPSKTQDLPIRPSSSPQKAHHSTTPRKLHTTGVNGTSLGSPSSPLKPSRDLINDPADVSRVDLSRFRSDASKIQKDPLPDAAFIQTHKRAERKEKNLRNIEKEHAMFEKGQLERLLEGLRGPDWLKVMGLTGITDGDKRSFEVKRDHFLYGVKSLLHKFESWREQERELKLGKDQTMADDEVVERYDLNSSELLSDQADHSDGSSLNAGADTSDPQLLQRAKAVLKLHPNSAVIQTTMDRYLSYSKLADETEDMRPLTSFYGKKYMRDASLSGRRRGRTVLAFGQPLPEPTRRDFSLPQEVLSEHVLASNARRRRVLKRKASLDPPALGSE
ncbi:hypothetical protein FH972_026017 [Carpinus fangiana]|uniref:Something about silencing protein 4 domain-containing protein n=1 Tax=Carpinus fangiana TaxID=176857 RepID=A0A5N6L5B9_9ROSI|nr:hypothetical protein FH972_026017 [Carpinus fangiana]